MTTHRRRPEDLGSMGESFFKLLAKDAGLVANASDDDKAGWDFEVEHPSALTIDYSSQSRPLYRVQVKTTISKSPKLAISYSSLLSLIQFSGPAFLFLICYGDQPIPVRAYLLHVTEQFAKNVLQSLRKKEVRTPGFKINKARTTISVDEDSRLRELNGGCLREMFEASVSGANLDYVKTKVEWLQAIEQDCTRRYFNIKFENEDALAGMANCFLGYEQPFNVTSVAYFAPLGIPGEIPSHPEAFTPTTIKPIKDELEKAIVRLASSEYAPKYAFSAVIYAVPIALPNKFAAMRIKTTLFEIVFRVEGQELTFCAENLLDTELRAPIRELHGFMSYMRDARNHGTTYLEVEPLNGGAPLKVSLGTNSVSLPADFDEIFGAFDAAYLKLVSLGLMDEFIRPSLVFDKIGHYHLLQIVGKAYPPDYAVDFAYEVEANAATNAVIFNSSIELEATTVLFLSAFFGSVERLDPKTLRGRFTRSELLCQLVIPHDTDIGAIQKEQEERLAHELRDRGFCVL